MLNEGAAKCAEAMTLRQGEPKRKHCEQAFKTVTRSAEASALPGLLEVLAVPETRFSGDNHRLLAAKALGAIGHSQAVAPLVAALDFQAGTSGDAKDKNANKTNEAVARALGALGDKAATEPLLRLMTASPNNYAVLEAVRALGKIKDPAAVPALSKVALDHEHKFLRKNAIVALGNIGDLKAAETLVRMMFVEYQGVSFYKEASFALYQLGPGVAQLLIDTMNGKNEAVNAYFAKSGGVKNSAIKAKCGFVLGDLRDPRAVKPLLSAFSEAVKAQDPIVMVYAAAPLGALGDAAAVPLLQKEMTTLDASLRDPIMRALNQLGDRSVVPEMIQAMTAGHFVEKCVKDGLGDKAQCAADKASLHAAQKAAADHASNLAGKAHFEAFQAAVQGEADPTIKAYLERALARVAAAKECDSDAACWATKLKDSVPEVREKAAWELGRLQDKKTLDALAVALADKKPQARSAAIMSYWQFGDKRALEAIEKQLDEESSSADFVRVNEDLKRLAVHLSRT